MTGIRTGSIFRCTPKTAAKPTYHKEGNSYNSKVIINTDGTGTTVSESGEQNQPLPFYNHAVCFSFTLVRANTPLRFVLSLITST